MAWVVFPYFSPVAGYRTTARVRRDHPEISADGKVKDKYILVYGDNRHLYFPPCTAEKLKHFDTTVVLAEAERFALALTASAERTGMEILPLGMGGCWSWRGQRIHKTIVSNGEREDVAGPLPDLSYCDGRKVDILVDANTATNPNVQRARTAVVAELRKRNCEVLVCELPIVEGVNGPDDYIGVVGDHALGQVLAEARPPTQAAAKAAMPAPIPAAPPLTEDKAATLTSDLLDTCMAWIRC